MPVPVLPRARIVSLLLVVMTVAATLLAAPAARAQSLVVHDPAGDAALPGGDLRSAGVVFQDGQVLLSAAPASVFEDPQSQGPWTDPATVITWTLADGNGTDLYTVTYHVVHVGNASGTGADIVRLADGAVPCRIYAAGTYWGAYDTTVPSSCVPGFSRFRAEFTFKDGAVVSHDAVPDHGDSEVVVQSGPALGPGLVIPADVRAGYWALAENGVVYNFGDVRHLGDATAAAGLVSSFTKSVDIDASPKGMGYWILTDQGRAFNCAAACAWSPPWIDNTPVVVPPGFGRATSLSVTPSGNGVWIFSERGEVAAFGDARNFGDLAGLKLNAPIVDSVATPSGQGYYMVAADGGVFSFGDAHFAGSMGATPLNAPVKALVPDADGAGYWLVAADGGIFAFDAPFKGSMGGTKLNRPVRGMIRYGDGYLMVAEDGGIFSFSSQPFAGSLGANPPASPVVSVVALNI